MRRDLVAAAGPLAQRPRQLERHARPGQAGERVRRAGQARVDQHSGVRQPLLELVVVGDDQFQAEPAGLVGLGKAGDAAVHRDHQLCPGLGDLPQRLRVQAVAFLQAVGHVEIDGLRSHEVQALPEDRGAGDAVGVVVAVDADCPALAHGGEEPVGRGRHAGEETRREQAGERRIEEAARPVGVVEPAVEEELRDDGRRPERGRQFFDGGAVVR